MTFRVLFLAGIILCLSFLEGTTAIMEMVEVCDNAIDDDGDGLIDLNDEDCDCTQPVPNSLIPNPSFEDHTCCPTTRSELNCAADWIQASEPTTDYINQCGWLGWDDIPAPLPFPDGEAIIGFRDGRNIQGGAEPAWKEYAGACMSDVLKKGVQYTFEFYLGFVNPTISPPLNMTFFGTTDCDLLPFGIGNSNFGCPANDPGWQRLGASRVSGTGWVKTSLTITPDRDLHAMAIGPECSNTVSTKNLYYYLDNLILAESRLFPKTILGTGNACSIDYELSIEPIQGARYQWYKNGVALVAKTGAKYKPELTDGNYAVMEQYEGLCRLSEVFEYQVYEGVESIEVIICANEKFQLGSETLDSDGLYEYFLQTENGCDSLVLLDLTVRGKVQDSLYAKIFPGEEFKVGNFGFSEIGGHDVILQSDEGCDSLVFLDLEFYDVFVPNVFSPNQDGLNDVFEVYIEDSDVEIDRMLVFDRWGNQVYEINAKIFSLGETNVTWDGLILQGKECPTGVYTYVLEFRIEKDLMKRVIGDLTLIR